MQSQHKINRRLLVDAINDKCANFRRKRNTNTSVNDKSSNAVVNECFVVGLHCATAFSMQSCAESAYQPYADGYHWSVHMQTSAYKHFNNTYLHMVGMQTLHDSAY